MALGIEPCTQPEVLIVPHREAMKLAYAGLFDTPFPSDETLLDEWRTLLTAGAIVLLARVDGEPAGTVAARVVDGQGWLERLYVHPDQQGRGVGRALVDAGLDELRRLGCRRANLWVLAANRPAIEIYRRWGWRRVPTEPFAPFGLPQQRYAIDL